MRTGSFVFILAITTLAATGCGGADGAPGTQEPDPGPNDPGPSDPGPDEQPDAEPDQQPDAEPDQQPDGEPDPEPTPQPDPAPEPDPGPDPDPVPCANIICLNGGSCLVDDGVGSCLCPAEFEGPTCETAVVPPACAELVCENGGVCGLPFDATAAQTCECSPWFAGATCTQPMSNPMFDGLPIEFWYRWQAEDVTPEVETLPEGIPAPEVDLGGEVVTLPLGSAAQQLFDQFGVVLDDADLAWDDAAATALLSTLGRFPTPPAPPSDSYFRATRTATTLPGDVSIESEPPTTAWIALRFTDDAFTLANPIEQPPHDGVDRVFYSNRLYRACVRAFFRDVPALEQLLLERYGITVREGEPKNDFQWFTYEELVTILSTMEDFPPGFRNLPNLKYMTRRKNGLVNPYHPQAPAIAWIQAEEIEFMESAFTTTSLDYLHRLVAHELSHFVYRLLDVADVQTWEGLSEWTEIGADVWSHGTLTNFVSDYAAAINPDEDFAESVSFYIYDPDWVRNIAPGKYEFLRDVLDGYEYVLLVDQDVVFSVFNLYPDQTFPGKIVRVTNTVTLDDDGSHHAHMELRLHQPPFEEDTLAYARLFSESGDVFRDVYFYPEPGDGTTLVGELTFGPLDEDGYWRPGDIVVEEWGGNTIYQGQAEYGWLLWFDNPTVDLDPPETNLDQVQGTVVKVVDEWIVTITAPAADQQNQDIVGYAELLHYDSGQKVREYGTFTPLTNGPDGTMTWTFVVRPYHATGDWTFRTFRLTDVSGNTIIHDLDDGPGELTFTVQTDTPDLTPPELDLASPMADASPVNEANPDGETDVWLTYRARDDIAGVGQVSFRLLRPSGSTMFDYHYHDNFYTDYFEGDPTSYDEYLVHIHLPVGSEPGAWGWTELNLCDKAGNCQSHSFTELGLVAPVE